MLVGALNFSLAEAVLELCKHADACDPDLLDAYFIPDEKARDEAAIGKVTTFRDLMVQTLADAGVKIKTHTEVKVVPVWEPEDTAEPEGDTE